MSKIVFLFCGSLLVQIILGYSEETDNSDMNSDGHINVQDIILLVNLILGDNATNEELQFADLNDDGLLNILDIIVLANIIIAS